MLEISCCLFIAFQSFSLSDSFLYHWSDDHGDDHFYEICRDKRNYTDSKSCFESGICNDAEPYSSEKIAYNCSCDHTNELDQRFMAVVNYQSGNNSHNDKADDVSACRTGQLCRTAGKSGKYRKTYKSKQKTAYEMESRDWSSDVCSSDLASDEESGASGTV